MRLSAPTILLLAAGLAGCTSQARDVLTPVAATAPGTSQVDMLVATTRSAAGAKPGEMFTGERAQGLSFAEITVSLPPDGQRKIGDVQWPAQNPGDPSREFVTTRADPLDEAQAMARLNGRVATVPGKRVLVFIHGFNNRFEEAVYRFAQIMHDSRAPAVPLLFTWPSRGKLFAYTYDRESATYSRDALEEILQRLARNPQVADVSVLAHSMGNWVTLEALRQMSIRNHGLPKKIGSVMLAAPDVDVDVFRTQIAGIEAPATKFSMFVSQDDQALAVSRRVWGNVARMGAIDPEAEPYRSQLQKERITVFDLTKLKTDDSLKHGKFASSPEIVRLIGGRLVEGQPIDQDHEGIGGRMGLIATGAASTIGSAAAIAVTAPLAVVDGRARDNLGDRMEQLGGDAADTLRSTAHVVPLPQQ
ncbi:Esterase/lipase superfamily enzyme [Rhizobiales bacterium GAS113]|nr:Esterase/lipase superfamily enzyme [Rhizobiales bacterium GAS113]SED08303.1 Esterase/lipase superfamily enzyme [Rhizobiales bacterium GAS188]